MTASRTCLGFRYAFRCVMCLAPIAHFTWAIALSYPPLTASKALVSVPASLQGIRRGLCDATRKSASSNEPNTPLCFKGPSSLRSSTAFPAPSLSCICHRNRIGGSFAALLSRKMALVSRTVTSTLPDHVCSSGVTMPRLIYGTAWKKDRTAELVYLALCAGFRGIDTACQPKHYEEPLVGEGIENFLHACKSGKESAASCKGISSREDLFIQTKFTPIGGQDPRRIPYNPSARSVREQVEQSIAVSLRNLKTSYIDSYVLHSPLDTLEETIDIWNFIADKYMEKSKGGKGVIRQLGLSNCYDVRFLHQLYEAALSHAKPAVIQNRFEPRTNYSREIQKFCADKNIKFQTFWTLTGNPHVLRSSAVADLSRRESATPAQVVFKALLSRDIFAPLTGTTSESHMRDDLEVLQTDRISLSEEDVQRVEKAFYG